MPGPSRRDRRVNDVSPLSFPQPVVLQPEDLRGRIAFHAAATEVAAAARARLVARYGEVATEEAAAIVFTNGARVRTHLKFAHTQTPWAQFSPSSK